METSASFEARSAPLSHPTANKRTYGSVRGVPGNRYPYRDRHPWYYENNNGLIVSLRLRRALLPAS